MDDLQPKAWNQTTKPHGGGWNRQGIAVMRRNAQRWKSVGVSLCLLAARVTRSKDVDPVAEATQVKGELLNGDREAVQQRGSVAGKKTDPHQAPRT
jgi:hypothetical protein